MSGSPIMKKARRRPLRPSLIVERGRDGTSVKATLRINASMRTAGEIARDGKAAKIAIEQAKRDSDLRVEPRYVFMPHAA